MKSKILSILLFLLVVYSCKQDEQVDQTSDNIKIEDAFNSQKTSALRREIEYTPLWDKQQNYNDEIYIPVKANKTINLIQANREKITTNNDIWLRGKYNDGKWYFSILQLYPDNSTRKFESGIVVVEDFQSGKLSYIDYKDSKFYFRNQQEKGGKRAYSPDPEQPPCKEVWVEICAGDGAVRSCSKRLMVICDGDTGEPTFPKPPAPTNPTNPPIFIDLPEVKTVFKVTNHCTNPCLKAAVDNLIASNVRSATREILIDVFNQGDDFNLDFYETSTLPSDIHGQASVKLDNYANGVPGKMNVKIDLNVNTLPKASREYVALTVIHETIHAYLYSKGFLTKTVAQHDMMWASYIDVMANYLNSNYGMNLNEAKVLATDGLHNTFQSKIDDKIYNDLNNNGSIPSDQRAKIATGYRTGTKGQTCK